MCMYMHMIYIGHIHTEDDNCKGLEPYFTSSKVHILYVYMCLTVSAIGETVDKISVSLESVQQIAITAVIHLEVGERI